MKQIDIDGRQIPDAPIGNSPYVPNTFSWHNTSCPHWWTTIIEGRAFSDGFARRKCAFCGEILEVLFVGGI